MLPFKKIRALQRGGEQGQSLLETAVTLPLVLGLAFNAINFAYFWFMVMALSAAPRHGAQYATQGGQAITSSAPSTSAVSTIVTDNLTNSIHGSTNSSIGVQVCSNSKGVDATSHIAQCDTFGGLSYSFPAPVADPEAPLFVLDRVDVAYSVTPIIPGTAFNVVLPSNLTFHRADSMRNLY